MIIKCPLHCSVTLYFYKELAAFNLQVLLRGANSLECANYNQMVNAIKI